MSNKINVLALGGLDERGKDCYAIEIDRDLFLIEAGYSIPNNESLGVRHIIPNFDFITNNVKRLKGIFISSADFDQFGALMFSIENFKGIPIYGGEMTVRALKARLEQKGKSHDKYELISDAKVIDFGSTKVTPFLVTYSQPDSFGFSFATDGENIIFLVNAIFEFSNTFPMMKMSTFIDLAKQDNLLLMIDSKNARLPGLSNEKAFQVENIISKTDWTRDRHIFAFYSNDFFHITLVMAECARRGRPIAIFSLDGEGQANLQAKRFENLNIKDLNFVKHSDINNHKQIDIFVVGNGAKVWNKLTSLGIEENASLKLKADDQIIVASPEYPGNEKVATDTLNNLNKIVTDLEYFGPREKISWQPSSTDVKMFINFLRPKYIMPIKGYFYEMQGVQNIALAEKFPSNKIIMAANGDVFSFADGEYKGRAEKLKVVGSAIVDENTNAEIGLKIIEERGKMAQDGIVVFGLIASKSQKKIISNLDVQMRGVVFIKNAARALDEAEKIIMDDVNDSFKNAKYDNAIANIERKLNVIFKKELRKQPIIVLEIVFAD